MEAQQSTQKSDRTVDAETPSAAQDLTATGEGVSVSVEDVSDDDTNVSDWRGKKQTCRDSSKSHRLNRKMKKKLRKNDISLGTWNVRMKWES